MKSDQGISVYLTCRIEDEDDVNINTDDEIIQQEARHPACQQIQSIAFFDLKN